MGTWLVCIAVVAMLVHTAWGMWLVRSQHRDLAELSASVINRIMPPPRSPMADLRPPATEPARRRFDPPQAGEVTAELARMVDEEGAAPGHRRRTGGGS